MAAGLKVFNANGAVRLDMSSRTFRLLAVINTGTSNGSVTVLGASKNINVQFLSLSNKKPTAAINQDTGVVSWTFDPNYLADTQVILMEF